MKVTVRNLGIIQEAEINLKPLTIFIGPNNAGKTWLAYTVVGVLGQYGFNRYRDAYIADEVPQVFPQVDALIAQFMREGNAKINLVEFASELGEIYINQVASLARQWMPEYMNTATSFDDLEMRINLGETKIRMVQTITRTAVLGRIGESQTGQEALVTARKESTKPELYFYASGTEKISESLPAVAVKEFLISTIFATLHASFYERTFVLPAERTGFIALPLNTGERPGLVLTVPGTLQLQPSTESLLSVPVDQFIDTISFLYQASSARRERAAKSNKDIATFRQIAHLLEERVLSGSIDFSTPEPDPRRRILFTPTDKSPLEMTIVSSMVKELAPLVLYLKYLASKPGELLVIDEPEMNLHPQAQAKIAEVLCMLVNAGLHLLVNTHSTYVVDHLNSLMEAAKLTNQEAVKSLFLLERTEAFLPQEKVSVYLLDQGKAESILDEAGVIHWDTFSDVTDRVESIHYEL